MSEALSFDGVGVVAHTGAGDEAFAAGADIAQPKSRTRHGWADE